MKAAQNHVFIGITIILAGMVIALTAIFLFGIDKVSVPDAKDYLFASEEILKGNSYPRQGALPFFRAPLYPIFISLIWIIFPYSIASIKICQAILHALTGYFIYKSGSELFAKTTPAILGAIFCLLNPFLVIHTTDIQTETLFTFLISVAFFISVRIYRKNTNYKILSGILAIVWAVAALCRPSALVIGLISIILLIFLKQKPFEPLKFLRESLLSVLCFFIVIIPWTLYNRYSIGEWILINDASGYALWASNHPESIKLWEHKFTTSIEFTEYSNFITATLASNKIEEWKDTQNYTSLSLSQRERLWQKESFKNAYENPYITLRLIMWKTWGFWRPYLNIQAYPYRAVIYSGILLSLLYLFSLLGFFRLWQENAVRQFMVLFIVYIVVTTLLHSVVYSMMRYRIPFIDPYMCMFAGLGLYHLYVKCYALACSNRINLRVL